MKGLKLINGILLIFAFLLFIPNGSCMSSVNEKEFLTPGQTSNFYPIKVSEDDVVQWSFLTYNDSFNVNAFALSLWGQISSGKTSDSGSVEALITGIILFCFQNAGSTSGYIDINIHIKKEIDGYYPLILSIIIIAIISIALIKKKHIKITMMLNSDNATKN